MRFIDIFNSLTESNEVPTILGKRKEWMNIRKVNREQKTKEKEKYKDDRRYNDHMGSQWLNTSATDMMTIVIAALDGCADRHRCIHHEDYMNLTTMSDVMKLLNKKPELKELIFGRESMEMKGKTKHKPYSNILKRKTKNDNE